MYKSAYGHGIKSILDPDHWYDIHEHAILPSIMKTYVGTPSITKIEMERRK